MKYLLSLLFLVGCSSAPKFRAGDCIDITAMTITDKGEWNSSGFGLGYIQVVDVIETDKINRYMAKPLHARVYYKIRILDFFDEKIKDIDKNRYVIPVSDLDGFRYAGKFWELPENNRYNCNKED